MRTLRMTFNNTDYEKDFSNCDKPYGYRLYQQG